MLLNLMYHHVYNTGVHAELDKFTHHLEHLAQNHPIVLPGEHLPKGKLAICLSFDDAYYDFYEYIYPLLKRLNIKALMAIPTQYILEKTTQPAANRLQIPQSVAMTDKHYQQAPFCTWQEIREMVTSGHVIPASHSHSHTVLTDQSVDLNQEITLSKQILEQQLNYPIDTFVYPCGNMTPQIHRQVHAHYPWAMRIGSALNHSWGGKQGLLYRIDADNFWQQQKNWGFSDWCKYGMKYIANVLRGK